MVNLIIVPTFFLLGSIAGLKILDLYIKHDMKPIKRNLITDNLLNEWINGR